MELNLDRHYSGLVWGPIRRHWVRFVVAALCTLVIVGVNLAEPQLIRFVIDNLASGSQLQGWTYVFSLWTGLFVTQHMALFFRIACLRKIECESASEVRNLLFEQLLGHTRDFYEKNDEADLSMAMTRDVEGLEPLWGQFPLAVLWYALTVLGSAIFSLFISVKLTLCMLVVVVFVTLFAHWTERRVLVSTSKIRTELGYIASLVKRSIYQVKLIRLYLAEEQLSQQMRSHTEHLEKLGRGLGKWHWLNQTIGDALGFLTLVGVLGMGGYMVINNELSVGTLVSFILYVNMLGTAFVKLRSQMAEVTKGKIAARRIAQLLCEPTGDIQKNQILAIPEGIEHLSIENIAFSYGSEMSMFEGVTQKFSPGVLHVICGANGTGKSTLLDILSGYTRPNIGSVFLNAQNIKDLGSRSYWSKCTVLLQEDLIFDDTIAFNLRLGNPNVTQDELIHGLILSRLAQNPVDAATMLSQRADTLSTGQKRRLAIARMVLRRSNVYLFDEPSANLDEESCGDMVALLHELSKHSVVIATTQQLDLFYTDCEKYELSNSILKKSMR